MTLKPARLQWSEEGILRSLDFNDIYFQPQKGPEESHYVFLGKNRLLERFQNLTGSCAVAELGFGSGLNFLLTARLFLEKAPKDTRLFYASIEKHPIVKNDLQKIHAHWPELAAFSGELLAQYPPMIEGFHSLFLAEGRIHLLLLLGDVADVLPQLSGTFDAWYLDGFSPAKNAGMWQENLFPLIASRTKAGGTLSTFSAAGVVRSGLQAAGFKVEKTRGYGVKRDMTVAEMPGTPPKMLLKKIAVLGAGLAGCSTAYALARRGHQVTVFDRQQEAGAETSGNPVGILYPKLTAAPSAMGAFYQHGFCYAKTLVENLSITSWNPCGVLHMDTSTEDQQRHQAIAARHPKTFADYKNGLLEPTAGFLSPPEFCGTLLKQKNIGTRFLEKIKSLPEGFDAIVIACGNDSKNFPETEWLPLQSLRGQISFVQATPASEKLEHVICHDGYIIPAQGGIHCIGATFQKEATVNFDIREEDHAENIEKLHQYLPHFNISLRNITGGRVGYRATTPDKLPMIGPLPNYAATLSAFEGLKNGKEIDAPVPYLPRIYLSTGFGAHGLSAAPIAGEIVAAMISDDPLPLPQSLMAHLLPERFILRDLKRKRL